MKKRNNKIDLSIFTDIIKEVKYGGYKYDLEDSIRDNKEFGCDLWDINPLDYLDGLLYDMCIGYLDTKEDIGYELVFKSDNFSSYFDGESREKVDCYTIFKLKDKYYRIDYTHCNYFGNSRKNLRDNIREVKPKEKTIIVYE